MKNALADKRITALQKQQYETQLSWLENSNVPEVEIILNSQGLINPVDNQNYMAQLSGLLVSVSDRDVHRNMDPDDVE